MVSSLLGFDMPLLFVLIVRGIASSLLFFNKRQPRKMLGAAVGGAGVAAVLYPAIVMLFEGTYSILADLRMGIGSPLIACVGGAILGGVVAVGLREPAERLLGSVSRDKLIDLTDLEHPLLQKMAHEAPGSWEHARAMANLAEAAAAAIGADALLTRVGAYYHDLGKTLQPKYFVENLLPGERSPHEALEPDVSADAIMAHVVQGTTMLREGGIPEPVVEFAYTHHGTQTIEFFWHRCKERGNPKKLPESFFRYPGMKPQTKETAILMLVDSIEAASRTIEPEPGDGGRTKFEEMIQRIIFTKLKASQLDDSGLTMDDLKTLVVRMSDTLVNMYHGRVKYPWQEKEREAAPEAERKKPAKEKPN
jgi:putative nucleotidyltransferase with HDIG domain